MISIPEDTFELGEPSSTASTRSVSSSIPFGKGFTTEMLEVGVGRLYTIATGMAGTMLWALALHHVARAAGWDTMAEAIVAGRSGHFFAGGMTVLSLALAWLARPRPAKQDDLPSWRRRRLPLPIILDAGLIYAVVCSYGISMLENLVYWPESGIIRGVSWVCLWMVLFGSMIPATRGKMLLTMSACAAAGPIAYITMVVMGHPVAPALIVVGLFLPNAAAIIVATIVSRTFYRLRRDLSHARRFGNHELVDRIDGGGMGEVWRAKHRRIARFAAVKVIRTDIVRGSPSSVASRLESFKLEAEATGKLRSPHTVELYDFGEDEDGTLYYVMELLEGRDLRRLVGDFDALPAERAVYLVRQACLSLAEAHAAGFVHGDIKPSNLFACRLGTEVDFVKVLDFGLVRTLGGRKKGRRATGGFLGGTRAFTAPEAASGKPVDHRADLYSLGCVAYWLVTGKKVFDGTSSISLIAMHKETPPAPPSSRTDVPIPPELDVVILRCLAKKPEERFQSALELLESLDDVPFEAPWTNARAAEWWRENLPRKED